MINNITGTMSFYIPYSMLKPVMNELNTHRVIAGRKEQLLDPQAKQKMYENLSMVKLPVRVLLGNTKLTLKEMYEMKPGDVLVLDTEAKQELPVEVALIPRFKGLIGRAGTRLAIQISGKYTSE